MSHRITLGPFTGAETAAIGPYDSKSEALADSENLKALFQNNIYKFLRSEENPLAEQVKWIVEHCRDIREINTSFPKCDIALGYLEGEIFALIEDDCPFYVIFEFKDAADAMLFKLTWGGK